MNIGIDIDGCLNSFYQDFYNYILKNYNLKLDIEEYDHTKFLIKNLNIKNINDLYKKVSIHDCKPEFLSNFIINKLNKKHNIYIITARDYSEAKQTVQWLEKYKIDYKDIFFNCGNKNDTCKYLKIDYMIDDSPYNIYNLIKDDINTIIFSRPYNKEFYNGNKVYIANNWIDIYKYIKEKEDT